MELQHFKASPVRWTFESPAVLGWLEEWAEPPALNLFAGKTRLGMNEVRVDTNPDHDPDYVMDAFDYVASWDGDEFQTVILDPPYSYRKSMEKYEGHTISKFTKLLDNIQRVLTDGGRVISFGYRATVMGEGRLFDKEAIALFDHGGAHHTTIGVVEKHMGTSLQEWF